MRAVYIAVAAFAAVYIGLDLNKLYALRYGADLGTYLQTLVNLTHGSSWNYGEWRPHFQVHDSWALGALVPLIAVFPRAQTLIVVQVVAVAAAAIVLTRFAREIGIGRRASNVIGIAYLLTPSAQGLSYDNFSENVFVPLLAFTGALFVRRRAVLPALVAAQLLMGLKEDEIAFVLWFAVACTLWWDRRIGLALSVLAVANGIGFVVAERFAGSAPSVPHYGWMVSDPSGKITMLFLLLAPFAFAPAAVGRWLLLAAPLVAEVVFMKPWSYEASRVGSHYTAPLLAAAAIAAAFGVARNRVFSKAMIGSALVVMLLIFNDTVLRPGRWPYVVDWKAYAAATAVRDTPRTIVLPRGEEGVWAVAAVNSRIRLDPRPDPAYRPCPAYDTNARAFFASLAGHLPQHLCGGVPMQPSWR